MNINHYAVIMAGGVGSRFWPVSRTAHPKQFIDILGTGKTLVQSTFDRFAKIVPKKNIYIITNEIYLDLVHDQLPELTDNQILAEPEMKNTAPCIAYACFKIFSLNPNASIVVAPSDHLILDVETFVYTINSALQLSEHNDCLITLGIKPKHPDTGYGYIKASKEKSTGSFQNVEKFTEKPSQETAKQFLADGSYYWNSGIFVWNALAICKAFEKSARHIYEIFVNGMRYYNTPDEQEFISANYSKCSNISIDYAVMEKADNVYVLPCDFEWSDLGTWSSIYTLADKDSSGNAAIPAEKVVLYDSSNCMVNVPGEKLVILSKLKDYIVAESNNTLLICPKDEEQAVKQFVADVKGRFGAQYI